MKFLPFALLFLPTRAMSNEIIVSSLRAPTTAQNLASGVVAWDTPMNALTEDAVLSTATIGGSGTSQTLYVSGLHFQVPSQSSVRGIKVEVKKMQSTTLVTDQSVVLYNSDQTTTSSDYADTSTAWPSSLTWFSYGSSTDTWGKSWTPSDINSDRFGAGMEARRANGGGVGEIDAMRITVYYTRPPTTIYKGTIRKGTFR